MHGEIRSVNFNAINKCVIQLLNESMDLQICPQCICIALDIFDMSSRISIYTHISLIHVYIHISCIYGVLFCVIENNIR